MSELESLKSVFKDKIFKIPDYQRGYAWEKQQLTDFWEDIINLPDSKYHYTGLLSLKEATKEEWEKWHEEKWLIEDRGYKAYYVVDGQQRLTTFIIFIQCLFNLAKKYSITDDEEKTYLGTFNLKQIKEAYLVIKKPPQFIINSYKFGYEIDNPSFKFLRHKIIGEPGGGDIKETFYTLNLENSKTFFDENLENLYKKHGINEIELLFKKVTQNLKFNLHYIKSGFDVFVAFETMNNRGKKLSNLELLKNRLIYLTTLYENDEIGEDERIVLRNNINDAWKEVYYQLGRNKTKKLLDDDFLTAHWIMYFPYTNQKGEAYFQYLLNEKFTPQNVFSKTEVKVDSIIEYEEIRDIDSDDEDQNGDSNERITIKSKLDPKEIKDYINSLKSTAVHWYNTHHWQNNNALTEEESNWIEKLNRIQIAYFRPLVAASFIAPNVTSDDRVKLFKEIERFIFIAFRLGRAFSTYRNSEFYRITRKLRIGEITVAEICAILRERVEGWVVTETGYNIAPFKTYLERKFNNNYGYYDWNGLRYFLYEYELEQVQRFGNKKIDWALFTKSSKDKVSIEHIYPQTPTDKAWINAFKQYSDKERAILTNSLGNLLPLSNSINSSLQNDNFELKKREKVNEKGEIIRRGYSNGSHSEIEVSKYAEWNATSILKRGMKLLTFMEKRWDIKFENDMKKKELLFLDFLDDCNIDKDN